MSKIWLGVRRLLRSHTAFIKRHRLAVGLSIGALVLLSGYLWQTWERSLYLAYDQPNCFRSVTILPNLYQRNNPSEYSVHTRREVKLGNLPIVSRQVCVDLKKAPTQASTRRLSLSLFNLPVFKKNFKVLAGSHPLLDSRLDSSTISVKEPLYFELDKADS